MSGVLSPYKTRKGKVAGHRPCDVFLTSPRPRQPLATAPQTRNHREQTIMRLQRPTYPPPRGASNIRIEIAEIENQGRYDVWRNGELICHETRTPMLSAARVLLERGADHEAMLEMARRGSGQIDMRAPLGKAAGLDVKEGPVRFVKWHGPSPSEAPHMAARSVPETISAEGVTTSTPTTETPVTINGRARS